MYPRILFLFLKLVLTIQTFSFPNKMQNQFVDIFKKLGESDWYYLGPIDCVGENVNTLFTFLRIPLLISLTLF
jgi:hypothetical protein